MHPAALFAGYRRRPTGAAGTGLGPTARQHPPGVAGMAAHKFNLGVAGITSSSGFSRDFHRRDPCVSDRRWQNGGLFRWNRRTVLRDVADNGRATSLSVCFNDELSLRQFGTPTCVPQDFGRA
jgi:hypothetical protein